MATLPRTKHGAVIASPFCNSPRKLQEMTFPSYDGHDVTAASGMSMRHYEEQLNGLKKENFHLKLRIYFLEEKLGTGSPPAVQGLLEHNVRLQVEVEELRRQLTDKQELLAAAAEAIDVLEQQGSISTDSVEASIDHTTITVTRENDKTNIQNEQTCDETCPESESAGDYLGTSVDVEGMNEISRLRREHRKALQMIKGCVKKIQQQDGEIKKLKLNKELAYAQVSDQQLEKYEEIVKCKDAHIRDLEIKVKDLQMNADNIQDDNSGNLQELLTKRLQGLAYFLDKLLSHKCVLGEDKQKLAESILEQSLALPVGLQLDESMAPDELAAESSLAELSQSLRLEDLTLMLGHHQHAARRALRDSDSECWSEPDRRVSLARIGLPEQPPAARARRARLSAAPTAAPAATAATAADDELEAARQRIDELQVEKNALNELLAAERANVIQSNATAANDRQALLLVEADLKEAQRHLEAARALADRLRSEKRELEASFAETEQSLRRAADEATVQASEAALERARAQHERLRVLRELDEARDQLTAARDHNTQLQAEIAQRMAMEVRNKSVVLHDALPSEEDRPTSPDQGIDSDRLSSLEQTDAVTLSPRSLYEENVNLKQKLARTKATLADTLAQLNAANMRKRNVQRAICREIHKTQGVLRKARDQLENQN